MPTTGLNLVCFGVEVASISDPDSDVVQIALKCGSAVFNEYIDPTTPIHIAQNAINRLSVRNWHLYRNGVLMPSRPLRVVLRRLLDFLKQFKQPCIFICHEKCMSNATRLVRVILKESMETEFGNVILGFRDTYGMFQKKFPTREHNFLTLHRLAAEAKLKWSHTVRHGRCVKHYAALLDRVVLHHFTDKDFTAQKSFAEVLKQQMKAIKKAERKREREAEKQREEQVEAERLRGPDEKQEDSKKEEDDDDEEEESEETPKPQEASKLSRKARKRNEKKEREVARVQSSSGSKKSEPRACPANCDNRKTTEESKTFGEEELEELLELYEGL